MKTEALELQTQNQKERFLREEKNKSAHLLCWFIENLPKETMIYKTAAENQIYFVRDTLRNFNKISKIEVISTHTSKSIKLPVYHIVWENGIEMILRDNFYDWKISVESPLELTYPINLFNNLGKKKISSCYCEGFKEEWVFDCYENNKKKFTVELYDKYDVYTFMFLTNF